MIKKGWTIKYCLQTTYHCQLFRIIIHVHTCILHPSLDIQPLLFYHLKRLLVVTSPVEFLQYVTVKVARRSAQITWYKIVLYIHEAPTVTYRCSCCGLSLSLSRSKERQLTFVMLEAWRRRTLYSVHLPVFNQQMNVIYWREEKNPIITIIQNSNPSLHIIYFYYFSRKFKQQFL